MNRLAVRLYHDSQPTLHVLNPNPMPDAAIRLDLPAERKGQRPLYIRRIDIGAVRPRPNARLEIPRPPKRWRGDPVGHTL